MSDAKDPCGVSTWAAFPFALIVAVLMPPSPRAPTLAAQEGPVADTSAESLARRALQEYRGSVFEGWHRRVRSTPPGAIGPMQGTRLETCRGSTLEACFGGELHCAWWGRMCDATPHAADRAHLLARLEALQKRFPGSDFVVGHLVDVALTAGDPRRALEAAERCGGTAWWCQALRGYARHARIPGSGDLQLDSALANAPADAHAFGIEPHPLVTDRGLLCEWAHAGHLWPDGMPGEWDPGACGEKPELHERFWWLADPLWSTPGNARWGEHVSRNLRARLLYDVEWRDFSPRLAPQWWWAPFNLHEEWTRRGFYNSWRAIVRIHQARPDTTHQLYVHGGYSFAPDASRFLHPEVSRAEDWAVAWDEGPERMHWEGEWHLISDHQTAILRRGEGLVAVTAARLPVLVSSFDGIEAALAMGRPSDLTIRTAQADVEATGTIRARLPLEPGSWVASIEAMGPGWVGRARFGAPAPVMQDGFGISRPLLVDVPVDPEAAAVEQALLPSTTVRPGPVGVYFELYGIEQDRSIDLTLSVRRTDRSLLGRIGAFLGIDADGRLAVAWTEPADRPSDAGFLPRFTEVDLGGFEPGTYRLEISATLDDGSAMTASVPITLRDPS